MFNIALNQIPLRNLYHQESLLMLTPMVICYFNLRGKDGTGTIHDKFTCRYSSTWCRKGNPGHGTRIMRGEKVLLSVEFISITCLSTGAARDPGHGTRIMRGKDGTGTIHDKFTCRYSSTWCHKGNPGHGTRIMRGNEKVQRWYF